MNANNNDMTLGFQNFSSGRYFNGQIGPILIYNRALSASEVLQNYNRLKGRFGLS